LDNSPVAVPDLPRHFGNALCRDPANRTKQLANQRRTLTNDLREIAGNLSRESKEHIRILAEFRRNAMNRLLAWRWLFTTFDFAQVGRFDAYAACQLTHGKSATLGGSGHSTLTQELTKRTVPNHV
jgi:hypothetical protein